MSTKGFHSTELIDRPIEEVWAFLTTWEAMPSWISGIESMEPLDDGPMGAGTRLEFVARGAERVSTIVAWEPPHRLALSSTQGGITACTSIAASRRTAAPGFHWMHAARPGARFGSCCIH